MISKFSVSSGWRYSGVCANIAFIVPIPTVTVYTGGIGAAPLGAFMVGMQTSGGDWRYAAIAALTSYASGAIGLEGSFSNALMQGAIGGIGSLLSGEGLDRGFASSAFSSYAGGKADGVENAVGRTVSRIVVGGTASVIGGGKFGNGAFSSAFKMMLERAKAEVSQQQKTITLATEDLRAGDVLLTGDGGVAKILKGIGKYGHAAIVISTDGGRITVLSADERGFYINDNRDEFVGGRRWNVFRLGGDVVRPRKFIYSLELGGGNRQYFGNSGGNVCSSLVQLNSREGQSPRGYFSML